MKTSLCKEAVFGLFLLIVSPCLGQGTTKLGDPKCAVRAITDQPIVFSNEAASALKEQITTKTNEVKQSLNIPVPAYTTTGWATDFIKQVQQKVVELINGIKDQVINAVDATGVVCVSKIQAEIAKIVPVIRFSGLYTYKKSNFQKGSWSALSGDPISNTKIDVMAGVGVDVAPSTGLGVEITVPVKLSGTLTSSIQIIKLGSIMEYPPTDKPSHLVSTSTAYVLTTGYTASIQAGATVVGGITLTTTIPASQPTQGTLNACVGHLLFPKAEDVKYDPICDK